MEDDDVKFWREEAGQRDGGTQTDGDAHTGDPQWQMTGRTVTTAGRKETEQKIKKGGKIRIKNAWPSFIYKLR
jgi:hypothetical protein